MRWVGARPTPDDDVATLRAVARLLDELASTIERYRSLQSHAADEPGRTVARRDRMRAIARRFPGAFRELDSIGEDGVAKRRARAEDIARALATELRVSPALAEIDAPDAMWLRAVLEVQPRLREVLRVKKWLAFDGGDVTAADTRERLEAWYADEAGEGDPGACAVPDEPTLAAIASPPDGHVQRVAFERAAAALGVDAGDLASALYAELSDDDDPDSDAGTGTD